MDSHLEEATRSAWLGVRRRKNMEYSFVRTVHRDHLGLLAHHILSGTDPPVPARDLVRRRKLLLMLLLLLVVMGDARCTGSGT